jgi:hypothetical protein
VPEAEQKLIKKTSRHEKGSSLGYIPAKVHSPANDSSEETRIRSSLQQEPTTKSDPLSKEKRGVTRKNCSSTDSYVSTLPPDRDCLSEESGLFGFSPPAELLTKLSGNRILASSPPTKCPLPASKDPQGTVPDEKRSSPGLDENVLQRGVANVVTTSRRGKSITGRSLPRAGTSLDGFILGFQASHVRTDGHGLGGIGENALKLSRSPSSHDTRHKIQRSKNISCGKRSRSVLDQDSDFSVEVVQISLPKSSKKSRAFQHSSIVPDCTLLYSTLFMHNK